MKFMPWVSRCERLPPPANARTHAADLHVMHAPIVRRVRNQHAPQRSPMLLHRLVTAAAHGHAALPRAAAPHRRRGPQCLRTRRTRALHVRARAAAHTGAAAAALDRARLIRLCRVLYVAPHRRADAHLHLRGRHRHRELHLDLLPAPKIARRIARRVARRSARPLHTQPPQRCRRGEPAADAAGAVPPAAAARPAPLPEGFARRECAQHVLLQVSQPLRRAAVAAAAAAVDTTIHSPIAAAGARRSEARRSEARRKRLRERLQDDGLTPAAPARRRSSGTRCSC